MARRGKRRRKPKLHSKQQQREILASPVSPHNDPLIKELVEKLPSMTNLEAAELGLALQRVVRGANLDDTDPDTANAYREYMAGIDRTADDWHKDRQKFVEDALDDANRPSDKRAAQLREKVQQKMETYRTRARMNHAEKKAAMQRHIKEGPFTSVYVEPTIRMGRQGDNVVQQLEGQVIGLNGVQLYLPPGMNERVPTMYAERYEQIRRGKAETAARQEILQGKGVDPTGGEEKIDGWQQVARRMHQINKEYDSTSGSGEKGDNWMTPDLYQTF